MDKVDNVTKTDEVDTMDYERYEHPSFILHPSSFILLLSRVTFLLVAFGLLAAASSCQAAVPPNVLFVYIDDMGYGDLSCYGNERLSTPNIDALANRGTKFEQFYVASPICSPSRVAVTTGRYPARFGIHSYLASREQNRRRGMADFLDPKAPTVARAFQKAGYATGHFGKWHQGGGRDIHEAPHPKEYGFDESLVSFEGLGDRILPPGRLSDESEKLGQGKITRVKKHEQTRIYVDRTIDFLRRNREKPFYVHLWLNDVHDGHQPKPGSAKKYKKVTSNPHEQRFFAVMEEMDRQLGRLFDEVDRLGLREKTLIVLSSDNGPTAWKWYYKNGGTPPGDTGGFRGRKWSLYEGGIRMPLIVSWPGKVPGGATDSTSVIAGIDLFSTFAAIAGIDVQGIPFDGQDRSDALLGRPTPRKGPLFWEYGRDDSYLQPALPHDQSPNCAIRDGRWKLLMNADGTDVELYDLDADLKESDNLAEKQPEVAGRLSKRLLEWRKGVVSK